MTLILQIAAGVCLGQLAAAFLLYAARRIREETP